MPKPLYLLLGIHHHQPVGNFGSVFSSAFKQCYWPLLNLLQKHPDIKISLHHSGPLLDFALEHEKDYIPTLVKLARRGQVELMGGGFYEPILPILKPPDAIGQIQMMQDFWNKHAKVTPKGMWLAERVWEPSLTSLLSDAGMSYTILDDEHFRHAGMTDPTLLNYYLTERAGKTLAIFPSDQRLRYMMPFKPALDVINHLLSLGLAAPGVGITYGDDGEKFGMWPGTYEWVIEKGWLDKFFGLLTQNRERIVTTTFSEFLASNSPSKTIYLPTASYQEMLEWAMPADAIFRYEQVKKILKTNGIWEIAAPFLRGGFFDNFLTKYPESNLMHKKMLFVSNKIDAARNKGHDVKNSVVSLYRSQCNCAYWHGLFGGLYLNHLRHAIYENLLKAETELDAADYGSKQYVRFELIDIDFDQTDEAIFTTPLVQVMVSPQHGGSITELSYRPASFNLQNTLARRYEAYHRPNEDNAQDQNKNDIPSIHEIGKDIRSLGKALIYDRHPKFSFLDYILPATIKWEDVAQNNYEELVDFADTNYSVVSQRQDNKSASVILKTEGQLKQGANLHLRKEYCVTKEGEIRVNYTLQKTCPMPDILFATEINLTLLAGHDQSRYYKYNNKNGQKIMMDARGAVENTEEFSLVDEAFKFKTMIKADPTANWNYWPIETVSQSEKGFDKLYQGSNIWISWKPNWNNKDNAHFSVGISFKPL